MVHRSGPRTALALAAILLVAVAGWTRQSSSALPSDVWADRARAAGVTPSAATALWIRAVQRFGAAALRTDPASFESIGGPLEVDLLAASALDPRFDAPWLGGTLMLRVAGRGDALPQRGRIERPDLPWHLLGVEVPR